MLLEKSRQETIINSSIIYVNFDIFCITHLRTIDNIYHILQMCHIVNFISLLS